MMFSAVFLASLITLHSLQFTIYDSRFTGLPHILRPVYHAISPAPVQPVIFSTSAGPVEIPFRTGLDRDSLVATARFEVYLKNGQMVAVISRAAASLDQTPNPNLGYEICVNFSDPKLAGCLRKFVAQDPNNPAIVNGSFKNEFGDRTFRLSILPNKLYVPTEEETGDPVNHPEIFLTPENTLSLLEDPNKDGIPTLKIADQITKVLRAAEGAYVEGVIRFELVPTPAQVVARRPWSRAP